MEQKVVSITEYDSSFEIWGAKGKVQLILWKETRYTKENNRKIYKFPGLKNKNKVYPLNDTLS